MKRETDLGLRKTPSRRTKPIKTFEKRLPAAGNGKKRSKNGFPRREGGKIFWRSVSRHGKWGFFAEKRFPPPNHPTRPPHKPSSTRLVAEQKKLQVETE